MSVIEPRTLRGFRDTMPEVAVHRTAMLATIERSFGSFGYSPIDTPALEYAQILKGKGGDESDKQMFEFTDQGGRNVAMRFDLTVPLARYVAQHQGRLTFPFRAYHVGYAWRGERPQKGRYREFFQCDADIIGVTGPVADAEMVTVIATTLASLDIGEFVLRVNDRRILNALLDDLGTVVEHAAVLRALDKLDKIGADGVAAELTEAGLTPSHAERVLDFAAAGQDSTAATLNALAEEMGTAGDAVLDDLRTVFDLVAAAGVPEGRVRLDPSIARGLDYYTGIVYETSLVDHPEVGSISSGGRYDDLAGLYTNTALPGVGGSIGLTRILAALENDLAERRRPRPLVVIAHPADGDVVALVDLAARLRDGGLDVEQYPVTRKHKAQMRFADARGARLMLTLDADGSVLVKDLETGAATSCPLADVAATVQSALD
jgi:histidyl-tRNA synthetase